MDDDPLICGYIGLLLRKEGYAVLIALDAREGWNLFQRECLHLRAVVIDAVMPGPWNGLELAHRVRATAPGTPLLVITGYPLPEPSGPRCAMLRKPFTAEALCCALRQLLAPSAHL